MNNELIRDWGLDNCDRELPKLGMFVIGDSKICDSKFRQIDQVFGLGREVLRVNV